MPLGFLPILLKDFRPPTEPFEPNEQWEHTYRIFVVGMVFQPHREWSCVPSGTIKVKRIPQNETFTLQVNVVSNQSIEGRRGIDRTEAQIICRNDQFASLLSWRKLCWLLTPEEKQKAEIKELKTVIETETVGRVRGKQINFQRQGYKRSVKVSLPITCDWAMIDVVQRLANSSVQKELKFAMLEDLEFLRMNQRLIESAPFEFELEGNRFRFKRFLQFGDGVLPWTYLLDDHNRLLLAFSAMKAILLAG